MIGFLVPLLILYGYLLLAFVELWGWWGAVFGYYLTGTIWYCLFVLTCDPMERPSGSPPLVITLWPITASADLYDWFQSQKEKRKRYDERVNQLIASAKDKKPKNDKSG